MKLTNYTGSLASFSLVNNLMKQNWYFKTSFLPLLYARHYHQIKPGKGPRIIMYLCGQIINNISNLRSTTWYQERFVWVFTQAALTDYSFALMTNNMIPTNYNFILTSFITVKNSTKQNWSFKTCLIPLLILLLLENLKWLKIKSIQKYEETIINIIVGIIYALIWNILIKNKI